MDIGVMSQLPSLVVTDAATEPDDDPQESQSWQSRLIQTGSSRTSNMSRKSPDKKIRKIPQDIRSVDSGYCESSTAPEVLSPDALPSMPPSLQTLDIQESRSSSGAYSSNHGSRVDAVQEVREHLVHKIEKAVDGKGKGKKSSSSSSMPSTSSLEASSSSSSSSSSSAACSLQSTDVSDKEIEQMKPEMPLSLKIDYQDGMVLYCDIDRDRVEDFVSHFNDIKLYDRVRPKIVLYDELSAAIGSEFKALEFGLDRCTYIFLFITKHFVEDSWSEFSSETCLMEAIHNANKKWCVVPVFTEPKRSVSFRVPASLNSLKGIQYWTNDKFFRESVKRLLEERLYVRKKKEKQLVSDRKEWITKFKIQEMEESTRSKKEEMDRQQRLIEAQEKLRLQETGNQLQHQKTLRQVQSETQAMMMQFAEKFNVSKSQSDPALTAEQAIQAQDAVARLLQMAHSQFAAQAHANPGMVPPPNFYLPHAQAYVQPPNQNAQISLAQNTGPGMTAVQEGQGVAETSHQVSDGGSTGFSVPSGASASPLPPQASRHGVSQNFSLSNQQTSRTSVPGFQSLPTGVGSCGDQSRMSGRGQPDLEEDQPHGSLSMPQMKNKQDFAGGPASMTSRPHPQSKSEHGSSENTDPKCVEPPGQIKEVHYHYHYYDNPSNPGAKKAEEPKPINIVGAKVVQIGENNVVNVTHFSDDDVSTEEEQETDDQPQQSAANINRRSLDASEVPVNRVQPPSTIFQDNNPSIPCASLSTSRQDVPTTPKSKVKSANLPTAHISPMSRMSSASGPRSATGQVTGGTPEGFRDLPNVQRTHPSLSSLQRGVSPVLVSRGSGDACGDDTQAKRVMEASVTHREEVEEEITQQTLAKQLALESEID